MDYATMSKNLKADKIAGWLYFAPFSLKIIYTQNLRGVFHSEAPNGRADFPELNAMIDRTDAAASLAEYEAGMKEIQEYIYSNYLATGVFTGGIMYAFSDKVENLSWNAAPWDTNLISAVTR